MTYWKTFSFGILHPNQIHAYDFMQRFVIKARVLIHEKNLDSSSTTIVDGKETGVSLRFDASRYQNICEYDSVLKNHQ